MCHIKGIDCQVQGYCANIWSDGIERYGSQAPPLPIIIELKTMLFGTVTTIRCEKFDSPVDNVDVNVQFCGVVN